MTVPVVQFTIAGVPRDAGDPLADTSAGASGMDEGRPYTVVYDGHCKVCGKMVRVLRGWDARSRQLEIVPSQLPGLDVRFPWIPAAAYVSALQLIGPGGQTWQGAAAIERLIDVLPRGGWISWVFHIPFVRTLANRFYRWFARNRYRLGCGDHCAMHSA
ncbi:MAG: thiol-disulfide oxidoreductase DCC family protein [Gemmatirosa sp.]